MTFVTFEVFSLDLLVSFNYLVGVVKQCHVYLLAKLTAKTHFGRFCTFHESLKTSASGMNYEHQTGS